jgi:hypothetical protein
MKKLLGVILALSILGTAFLLNTNAVAKQVDSNIDAIVDNIDKMRNEHAALASSSNPYDYIKDNSDFNSLVEIGPDALPIIKQRVDKSSENGLKEYILAIAAERIAKVDLKGDNFGWSTAKEWSDKWNNHLKNLPTNFKDIIKSDKKSETKNAEVIKLGIPALPFIIDEVEQGNTDLIPALQKLVEGNKKISFDTNSVKDYTEWAKSNKENVQDLRELVN